MDLATGSSPCFVLIFNFFGVLVFWCFLFFIFIFAYVFMFLCFGRFGQLGSNI